LKVWHLQEDEILHRRNSPGPPNYMEHFEEIRKKALEHAKKYHNNVYQEFSKAEGGRDENKPKANKAPVIV
jgi:hypothetical protein